MSVALLAIGTAVPPHRIGQAEAAAAAERMFAERLPGYQRLRGVFATTGIEQRWAARPIDWYTSQRGWPERTAAFLDSATDLFVRASEQALARAGVGAAEVDIIVTVCSTGIATPSLEARAMRQLPFRPDVARFPLFGLGCAGGVAGLGLAASLARSRPGATVLVVAVELCTLAFRLDKLTKANIVATALFGDGAAAAVLCSGDAGRVQIGQGQQHTWPDTLAVMGWEVDPVGFGVIFDRAIPGFAVEHLPAAVDAILGRAGLTPAEIDRWICHPGGTKVLAALETALGLAPGTLDREREVLRDFGNMSAPTALFVLERLLADGLRGRNLLMALGPGFTLSCLPITADA